MSRPAFGHPGHTSPRLRDLLTGVAISWAAIIDAALEHEFVQDADEEEGGAGVGIVLVAAFILAAFFVSAVGVSGVRP